jgi:hypothetical protein
MIATAACVLLRRFGDHRIGRDHETRDRRRVLQRITRDLGRIEDVHFDHVAKLAGLRVVAEVGLAVGDLVADHARHFTGVRDNLAQRRFHRALGDLDAVLLVFVVALELGKARQRTDQRDAATDHRVDVVIAMHTHRPQSHSVCTTKPHFRQPWICPFRPPPGSACATTIALASCATNSFRASALSLLICRESTAAETTTRCPQVIASSHRGPRRAVLTDRARTTIAGLWASSNNSKAERSNEEWKPLITGACSRARCITQSSPARMAEPGQRRDAKNAVSGPSSQRAWPRPDRDAPTCSCRQI